MDIFRIHCVSWEMSIFYSVGFAAVFGERRCVRSRIPLEGNNLQSIYFFSGPCGSGKTTLAKAYAEYLANQGGGRPVYLIHGDCFHDGFVEPDAASSGNMQAAGCLPWAEILKFNWKCIIGVADEALRRGLDVVIDYVVEDELPLVCRLAEAHGAELHYTVLTASAESIERRIRGRGDTDLIERALYLKDKLECAPENRRHLLDNTGLSVGEQIAILQAEDFTYKW